MPTKPLKTHDLANALGVHVNTIRLFEASGWLSPVPRGANGYRQFSQLHLEQARLVRLALQWPYVGDKSRLYQLVENAATGDLGMAIELAYQYLAQVRVERTIAESALDFLERWAAGHWLDAPRQEVHIRKAAAHLNVSVDMLRNWERNGLIEIPRDPANNYRLYGTAEFGRLRVIRTLVQAGYSLQAILRMLLQFDAGTTDDLRTALDTPRDDEEIHFITDNWLTTLLQLEERAQSIIRQIGLLIDMSHQGKEK
jgi:DNA-binding transcriptional MerR regulator